MAAAKKVKMEMWNGLAAVGAVVDDQAIPGLVELELAGDLLGGGKQMAEDRVMFRGDSRVAGVVMFGNEQDMDGGLGGDIAEGENVIILVDDFGFDLAVDDPFEDRFGHGPSFLPDGQFEELGAEMAGTGTDEVDDFVIQTLARSPPGGGSG